MRSVYEINEKYNDWYNKVIENDGEITPELELELESIDTEKVMKIENLACFYKNLLVEAEAFKAEKLRLAAEQTKAEKTAERIKQHLDKTMELWGMLKYETVKCNIKYRKSESVKIIDENLIDEKYFKIKREVSKTDISAALKKGISIPGAELEEKQNIQIK